MKANTTTSVINMVEVVSAAIVGLIFYGEALDIFDYIGRSLVISVLAVWWSHRYR